MKDAVFNSRHAFARQWQYLAAHSIGIELSARINIIFYLIMLSCQPKYTLSLKLWAYKAIMPVKNIRIHCNIIKYSCKNGGLT